MVGGELLCPKSGGQSGEAVGELAQGDVGGMVARAGADQEGRGVAFV